MGIGLNLPLVAIVLHLFEDEVRQGGHVHHVDYKVLGAELVAAATYSVQLTIVDGDIVRSVRDGRLMTHLLGVVLALGQELKLFELLAVVTVSVVSVVLVFVSTTSAASRLTL